MCLRVDSGYPWFVISIITACQPLPHVGGKFYQTFVREVGDGNVLGGTRKSNAPRRQGGGEYRGHIRVVVEQNRVPLF